MRITFRQLLISISLCAFPFTVNNVEHGGSLILLVFVLSGIAAYFTRSNPVTLNRTDKWIMLSFAGYFGVCLLFFIGHGFFNDAIPLDWELDHELRMMTFIPLYYLFLRSGVQPWAFWFGIVIGAVTSGIYSVSYVYLFDLGHRATGAYHAIAFGDLALVFGFMSLAGIRYFRENHPFQIIIPLTAIVFAILTVSFSAARGALIAVPLLMIVLFIQMGPLPKAFFLRILTVFTLLMIITVSCFLPGSIMKNRITSGVEQVSAFFQGTDTTRDAPRLKMWSEALHIFKANPLTGVGHGGYRAIVEKRAETNPKLERVKHHGSPHNMFLTSMVEYGILGLFIVLSLYISPLFILVPAIRTGGLARMYGYAGIILISAFIIFALTETIFHRNVFTNTYLIMLSAILALCRRHMKTEHLDSTGENP